MSAGIVRRCGFEIHQIRNMLGSGRLDTFRDPLAVILARIGSLGHA